jgi:hypothetical protein
MSDSKRPGSYAQAYRDAVDQLAHIRDASAVDHIERIIEYARANRDEIAVVQWLLQLIRAASHFDRFDREIKAFHELMAIYRAGKGDGDLRRNLLWHFKWLLERITEYVEVSAEQIDEFFEQMRSFYEEEGESLAPYYGLRYRAAAFMGDASAAQWRERWEATDAGASDDCPACQTDTRVCALLDMDDIAGAFVAAEPVLRGEQHCEEVPAVTFSRLLLPALLTEQTEMAIAMHRAVRRQVRHTPKLLGHLADHQVFLAIIAGPQNQARHAAFLLRGLAATANPYNRFNAARAAWVWAARCDAAGLPPRLPERVRSLLDDEAAADLMGWSRGLAMDLAERFDARNGSDRFARKIADAEAVIGMTTG